MLERTPRHNVLSDIARTTRNWMLAARRNDGDEFKQEAERLCASVRAWRGSRFLIPRAIDGGLAVSTIVKHKPRKHPPTTEPREFDTLFFAALFLMEVAGMRVTFQWLDSEDKGRYYLRGELSSAAGQRFYVARIILNATPGRRVQFDEDHHSYRLRDLIQRNGGGMLPDGKLGRQAAIDRCSESYATTRHEHHADLLPEEYSKLLADLLTTATIFHGKDISNHDRGPVSRQDASIDTHIP